MKTLHQRERSFAAAMASLLVSIGLAAWTTTVRRRKSSRSADTCSISDARVISKLLRRECKAFVALALLCVIGLAHAADPQKVAHLLLISDPPGFDPAGPTDVYAAAIEEVIFDRLLTYDFLARPPKLIPMAAEALPEVSDGGRTYTVRLKKGIYFTSDPAFKGVKRELTAQDFAYSAMRFIDPAMRSPYAFLFRGKLVGLDAVAEPVKTRGRFDYDAKVPGLEVVDRYTLRYHLNEPDFTFSYILAHGSYGAVAREVADTYGGEIAAHPVGSGAYLLKQWVPGSKVVLEANPDYRGFTWDFAPTSDPMDKKLVETMRGKKMPQIGRVEYQVIEEESAQWLAFRSGQLDAINLPPRYAMDVADGDKLKPELASAGITMYRWAPPSIIYAAFNFRDPVVGGTTPEKIALRRAIAMAYDREDEIKVVRRGLGLRTQMPIPPDVVGTNPSYKRGIPYDPAAAEKLLDRFGYKRGADGMRTLPDGKPLVVTISSGTESIYRDFDQLWQKSLRQIGIKANFEVVRSNEQALMSISCKIPIYQYGWFADYPDADNFMQLFYSKNIGESNAACYLSPAYDKLYKRSRALPDSPERNKLYVEMSRQLEADTVFVLQASPSRMTFVQPWMLGHKAHPIMNTIVPYLDIDLARQQKR
jgi:ABC-type transport system substrate-binding protein